MRVTNEVRAQKGPNEKWRSLSRVRGEPSSPNRVAIGPGGTAKKLLYQVQGVRSRSLIVTWTLESSV